MNSYVCIAQHPDEPDIHCNRTRPNHPDHSAFSIRQDKYVSWPNADYAPTEATKKRERARKEVDAGKTQSRRLRDMAERIRNRG